MEKVALFVGDTSGEFLQSALEAIEKEARASKVKLIIYTNAGIYGANAFYTQGEKNIINAPYLDDYDGIIVAGDTFGIDGMYEELSEVLEKKAKCPVVCIRQEDERFSNVLVDDYGAMCTMVEHFITKHGFTKICFMNGRLDLQDARTRLLAYINTMLKHGLKVTPDMVFEGDYWRNKGEEAVEWFLQDMNNMPQAIVCANDYMAVSVCRALNKHGIQVPAQICVSGYDDVEEAKYNVPPLTTISAPSAEFGTAAFQLLKELCETKEKKKNVYIEGTPLYRGTCCESKNVWNVEVTKGILEEREYIKEVFHTSTSMGIAFDSEDDTLGLMKIAYEYINTRIEGEIFISFCQKEDINIERFTLQQTYSDKMILKAVFSPKQRLFCEEEYDRRDILPKRYVEDGEPLYVHPLHGQNTCIGYVVVKIKNIQQVKFFLTQWIQLLGSTLERQRVYEESKELQELRKVYNKDALTGIGNRREIEKVMRQYSDGIAKKGGFCIISIDMDDLKVINDNYGHLEGDAALCLLANILCNAIEVTNIKGVAARIGGDEYMICLRTEIEGEVEKVIAEIRQEIERYNETSKKEWELSASIGYAFCRNKNGILVCMQHADRNMYEEKKAKKVLRSNGGVVSWPARDKTI